jgi:3-hydroxyacyl-CoA dehydrogenase
VVTGFGDISFQVNNRDLEKGEIANSVTGVERIVVVGAGIMGGGIATVCLIGGFKVKLNDPDPEPLRCAELRLAKRVHVDEVAERLDATDDFELALAEADLMIEAAPEIIELKQEKFVRASDIAPQHAVLATNKTSQLSVTVSGYDREAKQGNWHALV